MSGSAGSGEGNSTTLEPPTDCNPFDAEIYTVVAIIAAVSAFVSLLASCFVIFIIVLFKKWRFFTQRLILYLAFASVLLSTAVILQRTDYSNRGTTYYRNFCVFAGFWSEITDWMFLNAIVCITISIMLTAFSRKRAERFEIVFVLAIFVLPFAFNWIPFVKSAYGQAGPWCWIRSEDEETCDTFLFGQILQLLLFYIPVYVIMFLLIILYAIVLWKLHRTKRKWTGKFDPKGKKVQDQIRQEMLPLMAYPLIYFLSNIPPFVNRIHGVVDANNPSPALWFISSILFPLQGGAIAVVFSLDPETRRRMTLANFKAACHNFCKTERIKEFDIPSNKELERSLTREKKVADFPPGKVHA